jgi:uncharacterized protein
MAGSSLLMLLDDIATLLDDVSVMSKLAAKKTAGVLADDLALNAHQVSGFSASRELPVVWAVCQGSFINKAILVPAALAISVVLPWAITPLLMLGGGYLCYEGFEKLAHKYLHTAEENAAHHAQQLTALRDPDTDLVKFEKQKIKGAIRTDFILSAEIIVISLGVVSGQALLNQGLVLTAIAILMTVGVYGLVAGIVKLDDGGLYLLQKRGDELLIRSQRYLGNLMLAIAPKLMKFLAIAGTAAMFLVGGGILVHGIPGSHELVHRIEVAVHTLPGIGILLELLTPLAVNGLAGIMAGALVLPGVLGIQQLLKACRSRA